MAREAPEIGYDFAERFAQVIGGDEKFAAGVANDAPDPDIVFRSLTPERVAAVAATELGVSPDHRFDWRLRAITGYVGRQRSLDEDGSLFRKARHNPSSAMSGSQEAELAEESSTGNSSSGSPDTPATQRFSVDPL